MIEFLKVREAPTQCAREKIVLKKINFAHWKCSSDRSNFNSFTSKPTKNNNLFLYTPEDMSRGQSVESI